MREQKFNFVTTKDFDDYLNDNYKEVEIENLFFLPSEILRGTGLLYNQAYDQWLEDIVERGVAETRENYEGVVTYYWRNLYG